MLDGKQLKAGTVALAKLVASEVATILRQDGSVTMTGPLNAGSQRLTNLGAPTSPNDAARLQDLQSMPWKEKCLCATTGNINLATVGTSTAIDGITVNVGDRVLVRAQTAGAENGIYVVGSSAWARSADADTAAELRAAFVGVEQGTLYADHRFAMTTDSVTLGTTALTWVDIGTGTLAAFPTSLNKAMAASLTSADFQAACASTIGAKPAQGSYVRVKVNGLDVVLGDGVKTKDCYFTGDSGTTAKTIANIAQGDALYWVQSVAGYNLATTDIIDFDYLV